MAKVVWEPGWYDRIEHAVDDLMEHLAEDVYNTMVFTAPVRTGHLKADLAWEYNKRSKTARIGAKSVPYAIYVEEGAAPHGIDPKVKGALYWDGARHPVNHVNHPGTPATHFMKHALYKERTP